MNKVYLSGVVHDQPQLVSKSEEPAHLVFQLMVSHRSKAGIQRELYRISAWSACATYCGVNLARGMKVAIQGYLTQRQLSIEGRTFTAVEVTVSEIFLPTQPAKPLPDEATGLDAG